VPKKHYNPYLGPPQDKEQSKGGGAGSPSKDSTTGNLLQNIVLKDYDISGNKVTAAYTYDPGTKTTSGSPKRRKVKRDPTKEFPYKATFAWSKKKALAWDKQLLTDFADKTSSPEKQLKGVGLFRSYKDKTKLVYYPRNTLEYDNHNSMSPGHLPHYNIQDLLARFFLNCHYNISRMENWRDFCIGISSRFGGSAKTVQTIHTPMFDYDGKNAKKKALEDIRRFQETSALGTAWVYSTRRGYHVYFFCDEMGWEKYKVLLQNSQCCSGFKKSTTKNREATLRVSAKYTDFDIALESVIAPKNSAKRCIPGSRLQIVQGLINLGHACDTHFASLFPEWARFFEDLEPWTPIEREKSLAFPDSKIKRIRKIKTSNEPVLEQNVAQNFLGFNATIATAANEEVKYPEDLFPGFDKKAPIKSKGDWKTYTNSINWATTSSETTLSNIPEKNDTP
jgi:hypothetical protein